MYMQAHVQECYAHYKESTRMHKKPTTITVPSPRATRAKSTKRHVQNEAEERGGEEQEEEGRMKEGRDKVQKTTQSTRTYSNGAARGRTDAIGVMPPVRDVCVRREKERRCDS